MLRALNIYSKTRKYWGFLILSTTILIGISILIQHFFLLKPCILCIYQRCALLGITIAGIISVINPSTVLRFLGIFIWIYSASKGLFFSAKHMLMILYPSPFDTCDLFIQFPKWIPLNKWFPMVFNSITGDCFSYKWYFLSLEISQWMLIIFFSYLIMSLITLISQLIFLSKNHI